jgi:membrane peptidoglycan carboxypeptidase
LNVKTSVLNAGPGLCVPPDSEPAVLSTDVSYGTTKCSTATDFAVSNHGGQAIGNPGTTVQNALAKSSSTAFADLAHRVGTANVVTTAEQLGVDIAPTADGGSGLSSYADVNMGLGVAPLTVNEQDTMLSTIADDGEYHQAHLIKYWQQANGAELTPTVAVRAVLTAALDAQVQYAMEDTTSNGTAAATVGYGKGAPGTVIGVTGETSSYRAGSFLGATTQYSLAVGMFTSAQDSGSADSLSALGGGGYGGYWPSKIWNTFAEAEFSQRPSPFATKPAFSGADWNQVGKGATAGSASTTTGISPVPTVTCTVNGEQEVISGAFCPTPDPGPSATPTCSYDGEIGCVDVVSTPTCAYDSSDGQYDICTTSTPTSTPTPTPATTCSYDQADGQYDICSGNGNGL